MFQSDATSNLISWFSVFNFTKNIKQLMGYSHVHQSRIILVTCVTWHNFAKLLHKGAISYAPECFSDRRFLLQTGDI